MELRMRSVSAWRTPRLADESLPAPSPVRSNARKQKFLPLSRFVAPPPVPSPRAPQKALPTVESQISDEEVVPLSQVACAPPPAPLPRAPQKALQPTIASQVSDEEVVPLTQISCAPPPAPSPTIASQVSDEEVVPLTQVSCAPPPARSPTIASQVSDEEVVLLTQVSCDTRFEAGFSQARDQYVLDDALGSLPLTGLGVPVPDLNEEAEENEEATGRSCSASASPPQLQQPALTDSGNSSKRQRQSGKSQKSFTELLSSVPQPGASNSGQPKAKKKLRVAAVEKSCGNSQLYRRSSSERAQGNGVSRQPPPRFSDMFVKPAAAKVDSASALGRHPACILPPGSCVAVQSGNGTRGGSSSLSVDTAPTSQESCPFSNVPTAENCFSGGAEQLNLPSEREARVRLHTGNFTGASSLGCPQKTSCRTSGFAEQGVSRRNPGTGQGQPERFAARFPGVSAAASHPEKQTFVQGCRKQLEPAAEKGFHGVFLPESSVSKVCNPTPEKALFHIEVTPARNLEDNLRAQVIESLLDPKFQALVSRMELFLEKELRGIDDMKCLIAERFHQNRAQEQIDTYYPPSLHIIST